MEMPISALEKSSTTGATLPIEYLSFRKMLGLEWSARARAEGFLHATCEILPLKEGRAHSNPKRSLLLSLLLPGSNLKEFGTETKEKGASFLSMVPSSSTFLMTSTPKHPTSLPVICIPGREFI